MTRVSLALEFGIYRKPKLANAGLFHQGFRAPRMSGMKRTLKPYSTVQGYHMRVPEELVEKMRSLPPGQCFARIDGTKSVLTFGEERLEASQFKSLGSRQVFCLSEESNEQICRATHQIHFKSAHAHLVQRLREQNSAVQSEKVSKQTRVIAVDSARPKKAPLKAPLTQFRAPVAKTKLKPPLSQFRAPVEKTKIKAPIAKLDKAPAKTPRKRKAAEDPALPKPQTKRRRKDTISTVGQWKSFVDETADFCAIPVSTDASLKDILAKPPPLVNISLRRKLDELPRGWEKKAAELFDPIMGPVTSKTEYQTIKERFFKLYDTYWDVRQALVLNLGVFHQLGTALLVAEDKEELQKGIEKLAAKRKKQVGQLQELHDVLQVYLLSLKKAIDE